MRPTLRNDSFIEDVDGVAVNDSAEAMSDSESCSSFRLRRNRQKKAAREKDEGGRTTSRSRC